MNAKTAKKLRKEASKFCNPDLAKAEHHRSGANYIFTGQVTLVRGCFRAVYKEAKKILKSGGTAFA